MNKFYEEVMSGKKIFSLLYSPIKVNHLSIEDQIIKIETSKLEWAEDKETFFFTWGYPGPDYNTYTAKTYGKGWAFTKEEIIEAWRENNEQ